MVSIRSGTLWPSASRTGVLPRFLCSYICSFANPFFQAEAMQIVVCCFPERRTSDISELNKNVTSCQCETLFSSTSNANLSWNLVPFSKNILRTSPQDENNNKDPNGHLSKKGRRGRCLILNSFMVFIFRELLLLGRVTKNEVDFIL